MPTAFIRFDLAFRYNDGDALAEKVADTLAMMEEETRSGTLSDEPSGAVMFDDVSVEWRAQFKENI